MKKYIQNRNERLFNKLFESQGIVASPGIGDKIEDTPVETSEKDLQLETYEVLNSIRQMIKLGATQETIHTLMNRIEEKALYLLDAKGESYSPYKPSSMSEANLDELGVAQMTAWQHLEEVLTSADMGKLEKTLDRPEIQSALGKSENSWKASSQAIGSLMVQLKNKGADQDDLTKSLKYLLRQVSGEENSTEDSESNENQGVILDPKEK